MSLLLLRLQADINMGFRHFNPSFKGSDPSLETASRINAAFVFQKQGAASEHLPVKAAGVVGKAWYWIVLLSSRHSSLFGAAGSLPVSMRTASAASLFVFQHGAWQTLLSMA